MADIEEYINHEKAMSSYIARDWQDDDVNDFYWELDQFRYDLSKATRKMDRAPRF